MVLEPSVGAKTNPPIVIGPATLTVPPGPVLEPKYAMSAATDETSEDGAKGL